MKLMRNLPIAAVVGLGCITAALPTRAQIADSFHPAVPSPAAAVAVEIDGNVLIAGGTYGGSFLSRWHPDGTVDSTFSPMFDGAVQSLVVQADGKVLVGGQFFSAAGHSRDGLARLNPNGTVDVTFHPEVLTVSLPRRVSSQVVQLDGKIVMGGTFDYVNGLNCSNLARLHANGTVDNTFNTGTDADVVTVGIQPDGKILLGGMFTKVGGQARNHLARLNSTGALDTLFHPNVNGGVYATAVQPDGKILIGGSFSAVGGQSRSNIARLNTNGTIDLSFNPGSDGDVNSLTLQADGKIFVGGGFRQIGGQSRDHIARLHSNGTVDSTFHPRLDGRVFAVVTQPDGQVLLTGEFSQIDDQFRRYAARLNNTEPATQSLTYDGLKISWQRGGTSPEVWRTEFDYTTNGVVWVSLGSGSRVAGGWVLANNATPIGSTIRARGDVVGSRESAGWTACNTFGRLAFSTLPLSQTNNAGSDVSFSATLLGAAPIEYQWWKDGAALEEGARFAGTRTPTLALTNVSQSDEGAYSLIASNETGSVTSVVATLTVSVNLVTLEPSFVFTNTRYAGFMAVQPNKKILAGMEGSLRRYNSDGSLDANFAANLWHTGTQFAALQADGQILAGISDTFHPLGRIDGGGTRDSSFSPAVMGAPAIFAAVVQPDGKVVIAGHFTSVTGQPRAHVARLNVNATLDPTFHAEVGSRNTFDYPLVSALALQPDGKLIIGGTFDLVGGETGTSIARLNSDGTPDSSFNTELAGVLSLSVRSLALQPDGKVLVAGNFSTVNGQRRPRLARLNSNGTLDSAFAPEIGWPGYFGVVALALQTDGMILIGGAFDSVNAIARPGLARLLTDGMLDLAFNPGPQGAVSAIALQPDGAILVAGSFTNNLGQPAPGVIRLNNPTAAAQALHVDGGEVTWLRSGGGPEVWHTTFEHSSDGLVWTELGAGTRIPGGWQHTGVVPPAGGTIRARGEVSGGREGSGWFVELAAGFPAFRYMPATRTNDAGTSATFYADTIEVGAVSYRWLKNGTPLEDGGNIAGAFTATLTVKDVLKRDEGNYSLSISNSLGVVVGVPAKLWVNDPSIAVPPASQNREPGESASFAVTATGTPPLSYQWFHEERPLPEATQSNLSVVNLQATNAGTYRALVSNAHGTSMSVPAVLSVNVARYDPAFQTDVSSNNLPNSWSLGPVAFQTDGKLMLGGVFKTFTTTNLARLHVDGLVDPTFAVMAAVPEFQTYPGVTALALQPDGKWLIGGGITQLGGQARTRLGRLNLNHTVDVGFNASITGTDPVQVRTLALQADGRILMGGWFSSVNGQTRNCLARLQPNGALDTAFNPSPDSLITGLLLQPDGNILVTGSFTSIAGAARRGCVRLTASGTIDPTFDAGLIDGRIDSMALQADGKILIAGTINAVGGVPRINLARLNANGTLDLAFNAYATASSVFSDSAVTALSVQTDGKIVVAGGLNTVNGVPRVNVARLNPDGGLDARFNPRPSGRQLTLASVALQSNGQLLLHDTITLARIDAGEPVSESLTYDGTTVLWLRSGGAPEIWRSTFEISMDGLIWTNLGSGLRLAGGWELSHVSIPEGAILRARGHVATAAQLFSASWFVETRFPPASPIPLRLRQDGTRVVLSWSDAGFALQSASSLTGPYTFIPGASSPYTNTAAFSRRFFRLQQSLVP